MKYGFFNSGQAHRRGLSQPLSGWYSLSPRLAQNADSPPTWNMILQQATDAAHEGSFSRAETLLREWSHIASGQSDFRGGCACGISWAMSI